MQEQYEVVNGELNGWEIGLKIVTNGTGEIAVVAGGNEELVMIGPTKNPGEILTWIRNYLTSY